MEQIKKKDLSELIDEVLDSLSEKGELSKSEKEFMKAASKKEVQAVTIPNPTGNFWADMANPHNIGTMWQDGEGVWNRLIDLEEEEEEKYGDGEDENGDDSFERKRKRNAKKYLDDHPGLREELQEYLEILKAVSLKAGEIDKKYKKSHNSQSSYDYNFNQHLDYATNGTLDSLINQFGYYDYDDESGESFGKLL